MKLVKVVILLLVINLCACSCSAQESDNAPLYTKSGFTISPNNRVLVQKYNFEYLVLESRPLSYDSTISEVRDLLRAWWNNDSTFTEPIDILPIKVWGENAPTGFQRDGYIFLDFSQKSCKATLLKKWLELQNPNGLIYSDGSGKQIQEMILESITRNLLGSNAGTPSKAYKFFVSCPNLRSKAAMLSTSFKIKEETTRAYLKAFGSDAKQIVKKIDNFENMQDSFESEYEYLQFQETVLGID